MRKPVPAPVGPPAVQSPGQAQETALTAPVLSRMRGLPHTARVRATTKPSLTGPADTVPPATQKPVVVQETDSMADPRFPGSGSAAPHVPATSVATKPWLSPLASE